MRIREILGVGRVFEDGAPGRIRTCDLWIRNPTLYPAELRVQPRHWQPRALLNNPFIRCLQMVV